MLLEDLPPASSTDSGTVFRLSQVCVNIYSSWDCSCLNLSPFPPFLTHRCFRCWLSLSFEPMASGKAERPAVANPEKCCTDVMSSFLWFNSVFYQLSKIQLFKTEFLFPLKLQDFKVGSGYYSLQNELHWIDTSFEFVSITCCIGVLVGWILKLKPGCSFWTHSGFFCFRIWGTFTIR